jgi:hypothetical protein
MNTKSFTRLVASTILAAGLIATLSAPTAQAAPFGFTKVPECMNQEALEQIRQLEILEQGYTKWIAAKEAAIPVEQKELKDAEAALQQAVAILGQGANAYPAGFDPVATIDKLQKQIRYLVASIDDDERSLISMKQELVSVQAWLRADRLLKPCEESSNTPPPPGGDEMINLNDVMNGVPGAPPVLADPGLDPPSDQPTESSGSLPPNRFNPPLHGFPEAPPLKSGSKPLDGFVDPPLKTPNDGAKPQIGLANPERPRTGLTTPHVGEDRPSRNVAKTEVDTRGTVHGTSAETHTTTRTASFAAHTSSLRIERPAMSTSAFVHTARFGGAGHMGDLSAMGRMGGSGRMGGDVGHFGGMGHMGGMGFGGLGHMARF